ncbi:MAG TPA: periplasmic heavy metal sensor, partial [Sphingomonas sp.]|uniref:periplasmic heavy metal sensor n=1 Tax=Sphingomonas sp. TaxID=28214 RepID=UPI002ED942BA
AAPTLDRAALDAALDRARAADVALRTRLERSATAFAATLPRADRIRLARSLIRRIPDPRPAPTDAGAGAR